MYIIVELYQTFFALLFPFGDKKKHNGKKNQHQGEHGYNADEADTHYIRSTGGQ